MECDLLLFDPRETFVLLDDARPAGRGARLFAQPREIISAASPEEVCPALARLRKAKRDGLWTAGFIGFEAGYALEPRLHDRLRQSRGRLPLLWFGLFEHCRRLAHGEVEALLGDGPSKVGTLRPRIDQLRHSEMVRTAQDLITAGDIYQANITFQADIDVQGHPLALYRRLRAAQSAPYSAIVHTGDSWALSFSPELFFEIDNGRITTRPMKGTAARAPLPQMDRVQAKALAVDSKNRAENLMIVDLLRNDMSRVANAGTVEVSDLFRVDTYPTIHQMTSTVTATLEDSKDAVDVLAVLFPCGSVTGAPKIRAMEIIADVEAEPRGLYTGSIGYIGPDDSACFNVAIRTLVLQETCRASLGLGSGIVADSVAAAEWNECLAKAAFLARSRRDFDLIETLHYTPDAGLVRLDRHLARLAASAAHWRFTFDETEVRLAARHVTEGLEAPSRVRVLLSSSGNIAVHASKPPPAADSTVNVALARLPIAPTDPRLFHKTTDRAFYDEARAASGAFEVLFVNERGELTEGSFTNLFVPRGGKLLTPPLSSGLLPGVLRAELIETGEAVEAMLTPDDLTGEFFIGNSLRGLIRARLRQ